MTPILIDSPQQIIFQGEVKGEEVKMIPLSKPTTRHSAPSPPPPSPLPSIVIIPSTQPKIRRKEPVKMAKIVLLEKKTKLSDQELKINLPDFSHRQSWMLSIGYDLVSKEDAPGFDDPAFKVFIDDHLVYQQTAEDPGSKAISFNPLFFENDPQTLTIWSGNRGDNLKNTHSLIKRIELISQDKPELIEIEPINDLKVTIDNQQHLTLEWTSPRTNDQNLDRALAYEIRFFEKRIAHDNWSYAQKVKKILPAEFSPHKSLKKEIMLTQIPRISSGYIAIRSIDSTGQFSPLGESISFN